MSRCDYVYRHIHDGPRVRVIRCDEDAVRTMPTGHQVCQRHCDGYLDWLSGGGAEWIAWATPDEVWAR